MSLFHSRQTDLLLVLLLIASASPAGGQVRVDDRLPSYRTVPGLSGIIKVVGSDAFDDLMKKWIEEFKERYPEARIEIEGKSTLVPALISGQASFGLMSRPLKDEGAFQYEWFGYKLNGVKFGIDTMAVYDDKDNLIVTSGLSFQQLNVTSRKRGHPKSIDSECQTGFTGSGRLRQWAVLREGLGSSSAVQGFANDMGGVGYAGSDYPLSRYLFLYVNNQVHDRLREEFLKFVLSRDGQVIVAESGYLLISYDPRSACLPGYVPCTRVGTQACCKAP